MAGIALSALLAWGMVALAQEQPAPPGANSGNPGMSAGPHRGWHGRRGMGPRGMLRGLNLTDSQKSQLKPIWQQQHQQMQALRANTSLTPEQKKAQAQEIRKNTLAQVNGILTPEQQQQFQQRRQQWGSGFAGGMAQRLNLSEAQKTQMQSIFQQHRSQIQALQQDTSLTAEQKREKRQQIRQDLSSQLNSVLTPEQQQQWQQMRQHHRGPHGPRGPQNPGQGPGPEGPGPNGF